MQDDYQFNQLMSMNEQAIKQLNHFKVQFQLVPSDKMYNLLKEYKLIMSTIQKIDSMLCLYQNPYQGKDYSKQLQANGKDDDDTQPISQNYQQDQMKGTGTQSTNGINQQDFLVKQNSTTQQQMKVGYDEYKRENYQSDIAKNYQYGINQQAIPFNQHQNSNFYQQNNNKQYSQNSNFQQNPDYQNSWKTNNNGNWQQPTVIQKQQDISQDNYFSDQQGYGARMRQQDQQKNQFAINEEQQQKISIQQSQIQQSQIIYQLQQQNQMLKNDSSQQQQYQVPIQNSQNQIKQQQNDQQQQSQNFKQPYQSQILNNSQISQSQQQMQQNQKISKQQDDSQNISQGPPLINKQQKNQMIQLRLEDSKLQKLQDLKKELRNQNVITVQSKKQQQQTLESLCDFIKISYKDYVNANQKIDVCPICLSEYFEPNDQKATIVQLPCQHQFHRECLEGCVQDSHFKCPNCKQVYGELVGNMPDGSMKISKTHKNCQGYQSGSIVIFYTLPSGKYKGVHFDGTQRTAYLPDNKEGQEILELLKLAFYKRITFMIGRSLTTGKDNQVVWNLHHKTSLDGGVQSFGYPDPSYFNRIRDELKEFGIE